MGRFQILFEDMAYAVKEDRPGLSSLIAVSKIPYEDIYTSSWVYHQDWMKLLEGNIIQQDSDGYVLIKTAPFRINLESFMFRQFNPCRVKIENAMDDDLDGVVVADDIVLKS